jgi:aspartokinase-like uncharacterized kinase
VDRVVLLVGGGRFVDALRDLDAVHAVGESRSHALALRTLDLTAQVLASLVPGLDVVEDLGRLPAVWSTGRTPVLAPRRFLDDDDRSPDPLPHSWTTTSDAIAARLAVRLGAARLLLLKSAPLPAGSGLREAVRLGLVDPEFPRASAAVPFVSYRDFRDGSAVETRLGP